MSLKWKDVLTLTEMGPAEKIFKALPEDALRKLYHEVFDGSEDNYGTPGEELAETLNRDELIKDLTYAADYKLNDGVEGEIRAAKDFA